MKQVTLPSDEEAEIYTLGSMLCSINAVNNAIERLENTDFSNFKHQRIFSAMKGLYHKDYEINPESVDFQMESEDNTLIPYLYELSQYNVSDDIDIYIDSIKSKSKIRKYILYTNSSIEKITDPKKIDSEVIENIPLDIEKIFSESNKKDVIHCSTILNNYEESGMNILDVILERQENLKKGIKHFKGIQTNYEKLDDKLSGFCPGHMIVIAARPGVGKSTYAINIMRKLLEKNIPIMFFSMEMTATECTEKMICIDSEVPLDGISGKKMLTALQIERIIHSTKKVDKFPFYIDDQSGLTPQQIKSRVRREIETKQVKAVFIDYLTCMESGKKTNTTEESVRYISNQIRNMAKNFKIPFIVVAQENRESEKSENRKPKKSDLGQSGGIEQDAHSIIMLRQIMLDDQEEKQGLIEAYLIKNRFGPEAKLDYTFDKPSGRMEEYLSIDEHVKKINEQEQSKEWKQYTP